MVMTQQIVAIPNFKVINSILLTYNGEEYFFKPLINNKNLFYE